jgi:hypothetical protein
MKKKPHLNFNHKILASAWKSLLIICFLLTGSYAIAQNDQKIKTVFRDFQSGYTKRDTSLAESFCNRLFAKDIFIVGTGDNEWIEGINAAKNLVKNDWAYWLNLSVDTTAIKWHKEGNVILFEAKGTAGMTFPNKDVAYDFGMAQLSRAINNESNNRLKLLAYAKESSNLISEIEKGGLAVKYKIRLTGMLVSEGDRLVFKQLVFSFPYPMQRE